MSDCLYDLNMEVSVDDKAMRHHLNGYLAACHDHLAGDPDTWAESDTAFFKKHVIRFCEIEPARDEGAEPFA